MFTRDLTVFGLNLLDEIIRLIKFAKRCNIVKLIESGLLSPAPGTNHP
jgi:hypothetical protein